MRSPLLLSCSRISKPIANPEPVSMMRRLIPILLVSAFLFLLFFFLIFIPLQVEHSYGQASSHLTLGQRYQYALRLFWYDGLLTQPAADSEQFFTVSEGEPTAAIAQRLQETGVILDSGAFLDYLTYTGLDTSIQAGAYQFAPNLSIVDVARSMQDITPLDVTFVVLPGWRIEEIAASLPTSGLVAEPDAFLLAARATLDYPFLDGAPGNEGFFLPDSYILPRSTDADGLVQALVSNFSLHLIPDLETGFSNQGLTVFQAVTLASMVERESVRTEEMPLIASVFLNRLYAGWKLDSDPTVQYAVGFEGNWWPNPLSTVDLEINSPFNTYLYPGLPPAPIANPSLEALNAVAFPSITDYYFFRARCDGSGWHNFSVTIEEHIQNGCD